MSRNIAVRPPSATLRAHLILGLILFSGGVTAAIWPSALPAVGFATAAVVAAHLAAAVLVWTGIWLRARAHRDTGSTRGATIRWAFRYDLLLKALTLGRERAMREVMLERACVSAGERVLDVGCGTGTLAIAAKRRVGPAGAVRGIDAAAEMVARAKTLRPALLFHGHDLTRVLRESEEAMRDAGFGNVSSGPLGFGILGFALGRAKASDV